MAVPELCGQNQCEELSDIVGMLTRKLAAAAWTDSLTDAGDATTSAISEAI
jgi:hypothetical protein